MERKLGEVHPLLTLCGTIVENWQGNPIQKESLRVFFLVLQVTHYLDAGQVGGLAGSVRKVYVTVVINTGTAAGQNACHGIILDKKDILGYKATKRCIMSSGEECQAMSEAAATVYPDYLYTPR